jgi:hypothetical protein
MDSACEILEGMYVKKCLTSTSDWTKWLWQEKGNGQVFFWYPHPAGTGDWINLTQREKGGKVWFELPDKALKVLPLEVPARKWMHATMLDWAPQFFGTVEQWQATINAAAN